MPIYIAIPVYVISTILFGWFFSHLSTIIKLNKASKKEGPNFPDTPSGYILVPRFIYKSLDGNEQSAVYRAYEKLKAVIPEGGKHYVTYRNKSRMAEDPISKMSKI